MKTLEIDMNTASDKAIKLYLQLKEELALGDNPIPPLAYPDEDDLPEPPLPETKDEKKDGEFVVD